MLARLTLKSAPLWTRPSLNKILSMSESARTRARICYAVVNNLRTNADGAPGFYFQPAVFVDTSPNMRINREEIFGPVVSVLKARDYDEALMLANDSECGLAAGIATTSLKSAAHFKRHMQAGMVMVNLPTAGVDYHVPFGGRKGSSYGPREQGRYAAEFYTTAKTAYTNA